MASKKGSEKSSDDSDTSRSRPRLSGSKLARRARSFKEDFIDKITSIRSSSRSMSGSRSNSPMLGRSRSRKNTSRSQNGLDSTMADSLDSGLDAPKKALEEQHKDMQLSLRYFKDVIAKNRLEMLPGNATLLLETITHIHTIVKSCAMDEQNASVVSGLNQLYQSVAEMIKQCDDLLIVGEQTLNREHLIETITLLEDAVQSLISMAVEKIMERENRSNQSESSVSNRCSHCSTVSSDQSQYRISLSEITMSPYERQLLELTTKRVLEKHLCSQQTQPDVESIPPPKPPLPDGRLCDESPPPLPPKMRNMNVPFSADRITFGVASVSLERLSIKSDNSSIGSNGGESNQQRLSSSSSNFLSIQNSSSRVLASAPPQVQQFYSTTSYASIDNVQITTVKSEMEMNKLPKEDEIPPALPAKTRKKAFRLDTCLNNLQNRSSFNDAISNGHSLDSDNPPPLPLKKKHIMAYMEMFGNCAHSNTTEFLQRSTESYHLLQAEWQRHDFLLQSAQSCSFDAFNFSSPNHSLVLSETSSPPPALPPRRNQLSSLASSQSAASTTTPTSPIPPAVPQTSLCSTSFEEQPKSPITSSPALGGETIINGGDSYDLLNSDTKTNTLIDNESIESDTDPLNELDVTQWLVFKEEDDGPALRGGLADALVVLATQSSEKDIVYLEAFLITYRTFLSPTEVVEKLIRRFSRFDSQTDPLRRKAARDAFSLLIRVTDDLTMLDLDGQLLEQITEFSYDLLRNGELSMGFTLRKIWLAKYLAKLSQLRTDKTDSVTLILPNISTKQLTLLDFKSEHIAEQMTLLDAQLFNNIEIPEVLLWVMELKEEKSPNLTIFTEQFNKMSFWARTRILEQNDAKERERYMYKFLKVMKHLRKINNFNSYLALLAALDCAAVRRLEWNQKILDTLESFCILIDSASSFRQYRVVLAATEPPCIPYIGLVLQDLTFVHHGNSNYLNENVLNFLKRWQQSSIVANMKRFQNVLYTFKNREPILTCFNNFDDFLDEDELWKISKTIKP